ncbi:MAG: protein-L-isoaspartate O-methyltransferase [Chloroflexota bacterium]
MTAPSPVDRLVALVAEQVHDARVLEAIRDIPRDRFVPAHLRAWAYDDQPLPIGDGQTISQPTIVGMMTAALHLRGDERVLEIGTGSGYQAAVLARLCREVVSVEVVDSLREGAERVLHALDIDNVRVFRAGDDLGMPGLAPFDAIIVTAAAPAVPDVLVAQLAAARRLVIPVGTREEQHLLVVTRTADGTASEDLGPCRFVPLVGPYGFEERSRA